VIRLVQAKISEDLIVDKIRKSKFRDQLRFRSWWAARPADLLQALIEDMPAVLHFSGHGYGHEGLCFQSDDGGETSVTTDALAQVMRAAGASVTVVVLNACYSEIQAQALVTHIPCVVGMPEAIGDEAAILYAESFYSALASGKSVGNAHQFGLAALALHPTSGHTRHIRSTETTLDEASPKLLTRSYIDAERIYIVPRKTRCMVVIRATMDEFNAVMLTRAVEELHRWTGDLSVQIIDLDEGSVRLTVLLSPVAAKLLVELRANGQLTQICGFEVTAVSELRPMRTATQTAADLAPLPPSGRARVPKQRRDEKFIPDGASGPSGMALRLAYELDRDMVHKPQPQPQPQLQPQLPTSRVDHAAEQAALSCVRDGRRDDALKILLVAYGRPIAAFALSLVRNREAANDIRQQVFLDAFQGIEKFQARSSLWSWLCGIAHHRCLDVLRVSRRAAITDEFDVWDRLADEPDLTADTERVAARHALEHCLGKLPTPLRSQVLMRYFLGLSYVEIGEITGDAHGTIQVRMSRILPKLRRCLRGEGVGR
jgi:RNA polymerase sigma factor (sigma-70 family)